MAENQDQLELRGDDTASLKTKIGEDFTLSFDANPTTGYTWDAQFDTNYIELNLRKFEPSSELVGTGGKERFEFHPKKCGETRIVFIYRRPWEKEAVKKKIYRIIIKQEMK